MHLSASILRHIRLYHLSVLSYTLGGCPRNAFGSLSRRDRGFSEDLSHKPRHRAGATNAVCQPQLDKLRLSLYCRGLGKRQEITYPPPLPFDRLRERSLGKLFPAGSLKWIAFSDSLLGGCFFWIAQRGEDARQRFARNGVNL
jgi:hypothetical protein